jgi:hypothetical protein
MIEFQFLMLFSVISGKACHWKSQQPKSPDIRPWLEIILAKSGVCDHHHGTNGFWISGPEIIRINTVLLKMKILSLLVAIVPGAFGAGIPLYKWTQGRRTGEIPSQAEWEAMGITYTPWHDEGTNWVLMQLFALVGIFIAGLVSRGCFKESLRTTCIVGASAWFVLIVIGLWQYGWAIAD